MSQIQLCFTKLYSWTSSLNFTVTAPEMQPQNPFKHQCNIKVSPVHCPSALTFAREKGIQTGYGNTVFISEVLLPIMSRLFGCIILFSACHRRMHSNGERSGNYWMQTPCCRRKYRYYNYS